MRILNATVENFGSYKELAFRFTDQGLTLISGPTGSGKSTLCDIVPWILYGRTAKNGAVDEVCTWGGTGTTKGVITIEPGTIQITRTRRPNDLYYQTGDNNTPTRGKDLADTQRLINELLGADADTYLAASYFHEFSNTAAFFLANAKTRRSITEQLVDLSLATTLAERTSDYRKELKKERQEAKDALMLARNDLANATKALQTETTRLDTWQRQQKARLDRLAASDDSFEADRSKRIYTLVYESELERANLEGEILELNREIKPPGFFAAQFTALEARAAAVQPNTCPTCGVTKDKHKEHLITKEESHLRLLQSQNAQKQALLKSLTARLAKHLDASAKALEAEQQRENTFRKQLDEAKGETNPFEDSLERHKETAHELQDQIDTRQAFLDLLEQVTSDNDLLTQVIADFRGVLITNTVASLEALTNEMLTEHFDAEIRVKFLVEDADKLEVVITKDGNICTFSQLSKGQRQLLKLCFGVAVMRSISTYQSIQLSMIVLDEPTDGMDSELKAKSFGLLQQLALEYESVLVVEHSEVLKPMFTNEYRVALIDGESHIEKT